MFNKSSSDLLVSLFVFVIAPSFTTGQEENNLSLKNRVPSESELLNKAIKDLEAKIILLDAEMKGYRILAVNNEALAKHAQQENEKLREQIRELTAKLSRGGANDKIDDPQQKQARPNPPTVKLRGKITSVDPSDNSLVEISLGSDHGLKKDNTLEVFRLSPKAEYLGMIRIVAVDLYKSSARLVPVANSALRPQLKEGDEVASYISK